ncbi:MAG TPA: glycosyltransferase family 1 protein [Gaiellaceae bacterium]|nr:glycosyltransferase family 1 protein [Gaiellaceae bacterium]
MIERIVVDALQVPLEVSGVGRQAELIGGELRDLPGGMALEVRCPADVRDRLKRAFAEGTRFSCPVPRSRPRIRRLIYQQLVAPARDPATMLLVCLGDQGPLWGRPRMLLVVNDVRRLLKPRRGPWAETLFYRYLVPRAARRAQSLVTISKASRDALRTVTQLEAKVVAHHPRPRPLVLGAGEHFVSVGALRPYKDPETAIRALALLAPASRRPLIFVGPEEGRAEVLRSLAASLGVAELVRITGWIPDDELDVLLRGAIATVNPSTYEGYGLAVGESVAAGLPTVASEIPPHVEIGGDAILRFAPGDASGLAEHLARLVTDPEFRAAFARAARERSASLAGSGSTWRDLITSAAGSEASEPAQ